MDLVRLCPFDERQLARKLTPGGPSESMWWCPDCRMPFARPLLYNDHLWLSFSSESERRIALCRDGGMTDEEIRPALGVLFLAALESVQ